MITNLNLGPPPPGLPSLQPREREAKNAGSESFGKSLEQTSSKENQNPKEAKLPKPPEREAKAESTKAEPRKEMKPEDKPKKEAELSEKRAAPEEKGQEKKASREDAIKKFMDSFESEFEIPPTRLVEAIANLDEETQLKSPEDTADAVMAQLDLDPKDQEKAQAMYAALLVTLSQTPAVAKPATMIAADGAKAFGQEFRQRAMVASDQRTMTNMGVDRLNQKFWMKDSAVNGLANNPLQNPMGDLSSQSLSRMMVDEGAEENAALDAKATQPVVSADATKGKFELPPHLRGQLAESASPAMMAALAAKLAVAKSSSTPAPAVEEGEGDEPEAVVEKPTAAAGAAPMMGMENPTEAVSNSASQGQNFAQQQQQNPASEGHDFAKNLSSQKEKVKDGEKLVQKADFKNALQGLSELTPQAIPFKGESLAAQAVPVAAGASVAAAAVPTSSENETNIRQLMNQAQYLIKKGGGEVKVQMTPEGMGPVHLKMMVQDGKVNMQMSASTDEAKKAIESSLAELKTSLAAHKLSVDHVKVDVVNTLSADTATNNQMNNSNSDAQRDSARQFWNQFNDNFGSSSQRESFQEMANLKGYSRPQRDPLKPIEVESKSRAVTGKGSGLNLVA